MATITVLTKIRETLPAQESRWISTALSVDALVWASLPNIQLSEDGSEFTPGNYKKWSPAHLALRAMGTSTTPEDLVGEPTRTIEVELLQASLKNFQEARRSLRAPKTLAEAGLLAISLRLHWNQDSSWKGLLNQLSANAGEPESACIGVWQTAIACLYGMVPDPIDMLRGLVARRVSLLSYSLITHAILSNPLSESEQTHAFFSLISGLAPLHQIGWLRFLKFKGKDALVSELAHLMLGKIPASTASALAEFNPDEWDLETLLVKVIELQRLAGLYRYAGQTANERTMVEKAQQTLGHWGGGLSLQLAEIATLDDQPDSAEQIIRAAQGALDTATRLQQEVMLQMGGGQAGAFLARFPQAGSHPIGQIFQAGVLARDHKLNQATNLARQGAQQWLELVERTGEIALPNFVYDWQPRTAIQTLLDLGLIPEGLQMIESLLALRPADRELIELACMVWEQQENIDKALAFCETLATFDAENPEQHRHLASLLARKDNWEAAFAERTQVLALGNPPEVDDLIHHAIAASHLEKWQEVQGSADKALQVQPDNGLAYALLGQEKLATGKMEDAGRLLQQATLLAPDEALGWLLLAGWHEQNNDSQKSLETLRAAVLAVPESADINFKLARICLRQGLRSDGLPFLRKAACLSPESLDVSLELGETLYTLGRLDEAYNILSMAHHKWPLHPELAYAFAQAALANGDRENAITGMRVALKTENPPAEWQILYAETLMARDPCDGIFGQEPVDLAEAESAINQALEQIPDALEAIILKAEILLAKGALQQAHDLFWALLERPDANGAEIRWRLQAGLGRAALKMGLVASALASLQEASHARPENISLQHLLAEAFKAGELLSEALTTAQNALNLAPDDLDNLSWFAGMMQALGEPLRAVKALTTATQLCPNQPTYWIRLAEINKAIKDEQASRTALEKLLAIHPLKEGVLRQAAMILKQSGDLAGAIECLKRAVSENEAPSKNILVEVAYLLWSSEDYAAGLEIIQKAIELDTDDGALYTIQADFLTRLERYEAAIACLEHGLNLSESAAGKAFEFWQELQHSSEFVALEWILSACDLAQIHVRFARLYRRTGSLASAFQHAEAAFELQPRSPQLALMAVDHAAAMNLSEQVEKLAKDFDFTGISVASLVDGERQALASLLAVHAGLSMNEEEMDQSQECIEKGFEIDPKNARLEAAYATLLGLQGNWKKADEAYLRAKELTASSAGTSQGWQFPEYWIGMAAIETGHSLDAIRYFEKAIVEFPNEPMAHFGLGKSLTEAAENKRLFAEVQCVHWLEGEDLLTDDRYEEFEKAFQNASRLGNSPETETWRLRGRAAFRPTTQNLRGLSGLLPDPEIARVLVAALRRAENFTGALQTGAQYPDDMTVQTQVALTHYHMDSADGLNIARLVVEKRPNDVMGWITLGLVARKFGEVEDAYMALNQANSFWPQEPVWQSWAAELAGTLENNASCVQHWEIASRLSPEHFPYAMALGAAYLRNSQPYQAINSLERASRLNPNRPDLWYMLAQAYRQTGQFNVALQCAEKSGKMEPESAQSVLLCGEIHLAMGEKDGALECALQAWNKDRQNEVSILFYVKVLVSLGRGQEALIILDQAAGINSEAIKVQRAKLMASQRGPVAALPLLQSLATANPQNAEILGLLAQAQADCGDDKAALKTVSDALTIQPLLPELNLLMGKLQHCQGQLDHAVHFLTTALENDPTLIEAYLELARTYQERREPAEALLIFEAATKVAPMDYRPFLAAALMLRDGKDYVGAESLLRKAAELAPEDVNIRRQLGAVITLNLIHNSQEASTAHESYWTQDIRR